MKRHYHDLIAVLLSLLLLVPLAGTASAEVKVNGADRVGALLDLLDVVPAGDGDVSDQSPMTRGRLAIAVAGLLHIDTAAFGSVTAFTDVPTGHAAEKAVAALSSMGIFNGGGNGLFRPDESATYAEVITAVIKALGYDEAARLSGGYPDGYLAMAAKTGLLDGISGLAADQTASSAAVNVILYNALTVPLWDAQLESGKDESRTLLTDVFGLYRFTGTVTANEVTDLEGGSKAGKGYVRIDKSLLFAKGASGADTYLGERITFYYQENRDREDEIIYVEQSRSEIAEFETGRKLRFAAGAYYYEDEETGREEQYNVSYSAAIVYNGLLHTEGDPSGLYLPEQGKVRLVDSDNDGMYETVFITSYQTVVVMNVNWDTGRFYDKFDASRAATIDPKCEDLIISDRDGYLMTREDIGEWTIAWIAKSTDEKHVQIVLSNDKISGRVDEVFADGDTKNIVIDGKTYELSARGMERDQEDTIRPGDTLTVSLDPVGRAAAWNRALTIDAADYAYVVNAAVEGGLGDSAQFLLFTGEGKMETLNSAAKIKLNGIRGATATQAVTALREGGEIKRQLVRYKRNQNGELTELEQAEDYTQTPEEQREERFNKYFEAESEQQYYSQSKNFNATVQLRDATPVFVVPADNDPSPRDERNYKLTNSGVFADSVKYNITAFTTKAQTLTCDVLVMKGSAGTIGESATIALLGRVSEALSEDGDNTQMWRLLFEGKETDYLLEPDMAADKYGGLPAEFKEGDIVRFSTNNSGRITSAERIYNYAEKKITYEKNPSIQYSANNRYLYGDVFDREENFISVRFTDTFTTATPTERKEIYDASKYSIYVYDSTKPQKKAFIGTADDITDLRHAPDAASKVLVQTVFGNPRVIVVYQ